MNSDEGGSGNIPLKEKLNENLRNRLNLIIEQVGNFWKYGPHNHFTNHGRFLSDRVHNHKLAQLVQELPGDSRLNMDEIFIVSAAAYLYEVGMQSTNLRSVLDFDYQPGRNLTSEQLQQIRRNMHVLSYNLILESVRSGSEGPDFGLRGLDSGYIQAIGDVCRGCSNEPLEDIVEVVPISGLPVHIRLLVGLLRLADQLFIDRSRINLDLLQRADLPDSELAKWWVFHYAQTLPINKGKIQFHYFLPERQQEWLGHLRGLIEPDFYPDRNPTIRRLWDYGLKLKLDDHPTVQVDQSGEFQQKMSPELIQYLRRHVTPIGWPGPTPPPEEVTPCPLLVLDYENFVLQLGQEGYLFLPEELYRLTITLVVKAKAQHDLQGAVAFAHWDRPDLRDAARMLGVCYRLVTVKDSTKIIDKISEELQGTVQAANAPRDLLLVAPRFDMAHVANQIAARKNQVHAWICDVPDSEIYRAVAKGYKFLPQILDLASAEKMRQVDLRMGEAAYILLLDNERMSRDEGEIPFDAVSGLAAQLKQVRGRGEWWRLWLLDQELLLPVQKNEQFFLVLNEGHPRVTLIREQRKAVIETIQALGIDKKGLPEGDLTEALGSRSVFRQQEISGILQLLHEANVLLYLPSSADGLATWALNTFHWAVVSLNANQYLPLLALAIDHYLTSTGFPAVHEKAITRVLAPYLGDRMVRAIYDLGLAQKWVERETSKERSRSSGEYLTEVRLASANRLVEKALLQRDIVLDILSHRSAEQGMQRGVLWQTLTGVHRFSLARADFDQWLQHFEREQIVIIQADHHDIDRDYVRVNTDCQLTRRLRGRLNLYGLLRELYRLRATAPDRKQPATRVVEALARHATRGDVQLAGWTLDYAKTIHLVEVERNTDSGDNEELVSLRRHSFVSNLDKREADVCRALVELVKNLGQRNKGGWVPQKLVRSKMSKDERFGLAREEQEYWVNQALHRLKALEWERGTDNQDMLRVTPRG